MQDRLNRPKNPLNYKPWAQRNGFADWALALLWIIAAFVLFQLTAGIVAGILIVVQQGSNIDISQIQALMSRHLNLVFIGNSIGQILFLGLGTWFFSRLHVSKQNRPAFLRVTKHADTLKMIGLAVILIIAVQPIIWFFSWLNSFVPVPHLFSDLQSSQMQMIENYLKENHTIVFSLVNIALVPAICEEILYRGYVLRTFQKSWSIGPAIVLSGLLFGLYHVQLGNLLPLSLIGMLLAYMAWTSKSIYPAIIAHFINNGSSVVVGTYYPQSAFAEMSPDSMPPIWLVIISLLISANIVYLMFKRNHKSSFKRGNFAFGPKPNDIKDWVCVMERGTEYEVQFAKNYLSNMDIPSNILSKRDSSYNLNIGDMALVYLYVPQEFEQEARKALQEVEDFSDEQE